MSAAPKTAITPDAIPNDPPVDLYDMTRADTDTLAMPWPGRYLAFLVGTDLFTSANGSNGVRMVFEAVPPTPEAPPNYFADYCARDGRPQANFYAPSGQGRLLILAEQYLSGKAIPITYKSLWSAGWQVSEDESILGVQERVDARVDASNERIEDLLYDAAEDATPAERVIAWLNRFAIRLDTHKPAAERVKDLPAGMTIGITPGGVPVVWTASAAPPSPVNTTPPDGTPAPENALVEPTWHVPFVELVLKEEEFPVGSGKWKCKVAFINAPKGKAKSKTKSEVANLVASLKKSVDAARAERGGAPASVATVAPKAARPPATGPRITVKGDLAAPADDDSIPF